MTPSMVIRRPAIFLRRFLTALSSEAEFLALKRNWTALETLLTFCPIIRRLQRRPLEKFLFATSE